MKLNFQDETSSEANLVIGADGINSVVRNVYIGDNPVFSGRYAYRGVVPIEKVEGFGQSDESSVSGFWTQPGKHFVT